MNTHSKLDMLDKSAVFQGAFRLNMGSETRHPTFIKLTFLIVKAKAHEAIAAAAPSFQTIKKINTWGALKRKDY